MNPDQRGTPKNRFYRPLLLSLILIVLLLMGLLSRLPGSGPSSEEFPDQSFTVTLSVIYENRNQGATLWNFTEEDKILGLFMNDSWQTVYLENVTYPIDRFGLDDDGNPSAYMSFPKSSISPGENLSYLINYRIVLKARMVPEISDSESGNLSEITESLKDLYCSNDSTWQTENTEIKALAFDIAENETRVLSIVQRFISWINENIQYKSSDVPRYPNETVREKAGDCDDQANLLITFCRIAGIPAYLQIGCIYMPTKYSQTSYWNGSFINELTRIGWHAWAMVFVPPWGWLPVDLTYVSGDLRVDPLNAIRGAAIIAYPTAQYANVTRTDYVADTRRDRDFAITYGFRILEHDVMYEESANKNKGTSGNPPSHIIILNIL